MNTEQPVERDERTVAVENAGFKWAYHFLVWAILLDAMYRGKVWHETVGDLFALVGISVAFCTVYLIRHKAAVVEWRKSLIAYAIAMLVLVLFNWLFP